MGARSGASAPTNTARGARSITVVVRDKRPGWAADCFMSGGAVVLYRRADARAAKKHRAGQSQPRSSSETRSPSGQVERPLDRRCRLCKRSQLCVRADERRAPSTANHGHRPRRATRPSNTRFHVGQRRHAIQAHRRAQRGEKKRRHRARRDQSRSSSETSSPSGQSSVVARKATRRVSTAQPRAAAATNRTSDGTVSGNAHTYACAATWRGNGRRPITVVVRDERPV